MYGKQECKRLRVATIRNRDNIPPDVRSELSRRIIHRLIDSFQMNRIHSVLLYLSMRSEVETDNLLDYLLVHNKIALAPVVDMKLHTLTPHRITDVQSNLVIHPYGMREPDPKICPAFPPDQINLILVPGVAFDRRGYRLGYGGGFNDRFLPQCPQATWIGLAYEAQIIEDTLPQAWDVPVHQIVTEKEIYRSK